MADNRTSPPALSMGNSPAIHPPHDTHAKALKSAYICYFLAALVMGVIGWFVIEGVNATAPNSPARYARIVAGILQMILGGYVFSLAGQYRQHSLILRTLGWSIFVFNIVLMTLANYAVSATAGKAAALSKETVAEMREQSKAGRDTAKALQEDAARLKNSKHAFKRDEAGKKNDAAAMAIGASSGTVEKLEKMQASLVSTPTIEIIGEFWTMALSFTQALIMELSNIVLMHCAGSLRRKASSGAIPIENQILELLHKIHGVPVAPAQIVAPALASFKPVGTVAPKDLSTNFYGSKTALAGAGLLGAAGALTAPITHAAPAVPATVSKPIHADVSKPIHLEHANEGGADASNAASVAPETIGAGVSKPIHEGVSKPIQQIVKKPRAKRATSAKLDTGVEGKAGARFKRIRDGVKAGKIRPSVRGIQAVEGGSQAVVADYLQQLETEGVIIKAGRGYVLANSKGGAA